MLLDFISIFANTESNILTIEEILKKLVANKEFYEIFEED